MFAYRSVGKLLILLFMIMLVAVPGAQAQDTTLKLISWQVDEPVGDWWRAAIEEFESSHEGVSIEFTKVARPEYADTFLTLFAGGTPPDIVHLASFEYQQFADAGWMEDLGPWIADSELDLEGWAGQVKCHWGGQTACIMLQYFGFVMVVNDAILEEAMLDAPSTWDEYIEVLRATTKDTDGDGIVDQWGACHHTAEGSQYLSQMLSYVVGAGAYWTTPEGEVNINTPEMVEGFTRWKTILDERLTPLDLASGDCRQLMMEGKLATKLEGPWIYGFVLRAEPAIQEQLRVVRVPFEVPVGGGSNVIAMASEISDEKKALVWDFIEIITSHEWQVQFGLHVGQPAPRPGTLVDEYHDAIPHVDLLLESQNTASANGIDRSPTGLEIVYNEFAKMVREEAQRMVADDVDPAEVVANLHNLAVELQQDM
ncbi:MAG: extracellular solute-binding protein [Chloroflexota bacterium]|nr:extracellular solute-binding protein [Chloroflexota bacterium]